MATQTIKVEFVKRSLKNVPNGNVYASYQMNRPSDLQSAYRPAEPQTARLELHEKGNDFPFTIMLKMHHRNILRLEAIQDLPRENHLRVFVEPHDGPLIACLESLVADSTTNVIPSQAFRDIVRQIIEALEELRANGLYHGALTIHNIYYVKHSGVLTVKLANFRQLLDTDLNVAQLRDWIMLGDFLEYISRAARLVNNDFSCVLIDRLAAKLQGLTDVALLPNLKTETLNDLFFWSTRKRTNFYIHNIAEAVKDEDFKQRVRDYGNLQLPWNANPHDGLIEGMNAHRKDAYNGEDPIDNILCMIGAYTHQDDLVGKIIDVGSGALLSVDASVQKNQPTLCLTLYGLLTGDIPAEEANAEEGAAAAGDAGMNED